MADEAPNTSEATPVGEVVITEAPKKGKGKAEQKTGPNGEKVREDGAYEIAPGLWRKDN